MAEAIQATANTNYPPATKPTIYFIGMTTAKSSIMKVFPRWAEYLRLGNVAIQGIDCKWHDDSAVYRRAVEFIKNDPLSKGALVTTHKLDLLKACREMFEFLDPYAQLMGEISCISKRHGQLRGHAKDPISSGLALEAFLPPNHWQATGGAVLSLGAGGSSIAITSYLMDPKHGANRPTRIIVTNRSVPRLDEIKEIHRKLSTPIPVEYHHTPRAEDNDALLNRLPPHSLVMNATGLGKDAPARRSPMPAGSPNTVSRGTSTTGVTSSSSTKPAPKPVNADSQSKTAGCISSTAGRASSRKCSPWTSPSVVRSLKKFPASPRRLANATLEH